MADINLDYVKEFIGNSLELTLDERNFLLMLLHEQRGSVKGAQYLPPRFKVVGGE